MARNRFDIILIVIGLFGGTILSNIAISLMPRSSIELRLSLSVVGALVGFAVGLGLTYLISSSVKLEEARRHARMRANLPASAPSQIVGKKCMACEQSIIFAPEGSFCTKCLNPYCHHCKPLQSICPNCAVSVVSESQNPGPASES